MSVHSAAIVIGLFHDFHSQLLFAFENNNESLNIIITNISINSRTPNEELLSVNACL